MIEIQIKQINAIHFRGQVTNNWTYLTECGFQEYVMEICDQPAHLVEAVWKKNEKLPVKTTLRKLRRKIGRFSILSFSYFRFACLLLSPSSRQRSDMNKLMGKKKLDLLLWRQREEVEKKEEEQEEQEEQEE